MVSVSEKVSRPRLPPPKRPPPPPPPPPRPPKPRSPKPPPPGPPAGGPLSGVGAAPPCGEGGAPPGAGVVPPPRVPPRAAANCARIWSITDCEGRRDFRGLEKSKPIRRVSGGELSKFTGRKSTLTS